VDGSATDEDITTHLRNPNTKLHGKMGKLLLDGWVQQQNPSPNNKNNTGRKSSTEVKKKTTTKKQPTSGLEFFKP